MASDFSKLVAPCGMNCSVCASFLALQTDAKSKGIQIPYCSGCRVRNKKCAFLKQNCEPLRKGQVQFCYECQSFPCRRLKAIDERYRSRYRMSLIENLRFIEQNGVERFLEAQKKTWTCPSCGGTICCHNGVCALAVG